MKSKSDPIPEMFFGEFESAVFDPIAGFDFSVIDSNDRARWAINERVSGRNLTLIQIVVEPILGSDHLINYTGFFFLFRRLVEFGLFLREQTIFYQFDFWSNLTNLGYAGDTNRSWWPSKNKSSFFIF